MQESFWELLGVKGVRQSEDFNWRLRSQPFFRVDLMPKLVLGEQMQGLLLLYFFSECEAM
jgi:hypothetical protein